MVVKAAASAFCLFLLTLPVAAQPSENLVAKREACRAEAKARIVPKRKIEVDGYRRIVERRTAYVSACLERSVVAHNGQPLPPKRVLDDATDAVPAPTSTAPRAEPRRIAETERRKPKASPFRTLKGKSLKGKSLKGQSLKGKKSRISARKAR